MLASTANFLQQFLFLKNIPQAKQICPQIQQTISIKKGIFLVGKKLKYLITKNILKSLVGETKLTCKKLFFLFNKKTFSLGQGTKK